MDGNFADPPKKKKKGGYGRPFLKGVSGNPNGKPPHPPELKALKKFTKAEFETACGKLFFATVEQLEHVAKNPKTPVLEALVAKILQKGIVESSRVELNYFVERFLGKVPEESNFSGSLNGGIAAFLAARARPPSQDDDE